MGTAQNQYGSVTPQPQQKGTTMAMHTPGPWRLAEIAKCKMRVYAAKQNEVCDVWLNEHGGRAPTPEREANARLIAAAPELLETAEKLALLLEQVHEIDLHDGDHDAGCAYCHAIKQSKIAIQNAGERN